VKNLCRAVDLMVVMVVEGVMLCLWLMAGSIRWRSSGINESFQLLTAKEEQAEIGQVLAVKTVASAFRQERWYLTRIPKKESRILIDRTQHLW
jgi:hypothetical protein